ncbi:hypothetical protein [Onishia niordana]|uniref:hypothetical protein n=1 Tax=Onishia niordana TaxID=2508711 RepID=UPI00109F96DF|nr:hypothetical protein [Halomonas niordiana]
MNQHDIPPCSGKASPAVADDAPCRERTGSDIAGATSDSEAIGGEAPACDLARLVQRLCADWSLEVTPKGATQIADFAELLRPGTQVYVTHLPKQPYEPVIATAERLRAEGMIPVPHIVARSVPDRATLERWYGRLAAAGVEEALLIAGGTTTVAGPYRDTLMLLDDCPPAAHGLTRLGIAGHPEGHAHADREALDRALASKVAYAEATGTDLWMVTQFTFDAQPLIDWSARLQRQGIRVPVRVGLPGPASLATLLKYAVSCGVGASITALHNQPGKLWKMTRPQPPVAQLLALARHPGPWLGVHVYPFGGTLQTAAWFRALQEGRFSIEAQRLTVHQGGEGAV